MDNTIIDPCDECGGLDLTIKYRDYHGDTMVRAFCRDCGCEWEEIVDGD